jgi:hypothetical protein
MLLGSCGIAPSPLDAWRGSGRNAPRRVYSLRQKTNNKEEKRMPDYQQGKVYAIRSPNTEKVYIGSTVVALSKRFSQHKKATSGCRSKEIIDADDSYIELVVACPCNSKEELFREEARIMRETPNCINLCIPKTIERTGERAIIVYVDDEFYLVVSERDKKVHKMPRAKDDPIPTGDTTLDDGTVVCISDTIMSGSNLFSACREYLYDKKRKAEYYQRLKQNDSD